MISVWTQSIIVVSQMSTRSATILCYPRVSTNLEVSPALNEFLAGHSHSSTSVTYNQSIGVSVGAAHHGVTRRYPTLLHDYLIGHIDHWTHQVVLVLESAEIVSDSGIRLFGISFPRDARPAIVRHILSAEIIEASPDVTVGLITLWDVTIASAMSGIAPGTFFVVVRISTVVV